jgi:hypothetical protein
MEPLAMCEEWYADNLNLVALCLWPRGGVVGFSTYGPFRNLPHIVLL